MAAIDDVKALLQISNEDTDDLNLLNIYLHIAEQKVLKRLYPFGCSAEKKDSVLEEYAYKVVEITMYLWMRRGSEGETSHSENGVSRSYENADVPDSMVSELIPMAGVPS